jgi:hypothetical protein
MQKWLLSAVLVTSTGQAPETVRYRILALEVPQSTIAEGQRTYIPDRDVSVQETRAKDGTTFWSKRLLLASGFSLEAHVTREPAVDGFGLVVTNPENSEEFSWNWFDRDGTDRFVKLRGPGHLVVQLRSAGDLLELDSIEFLDDVALTYKRQVGGEYTHELVVKKGSVFRMAR